jgi:urease accessory protein
MLIEAPLDNLGPAVDPDADDRRIDWLDLTWAQALQRAIRQTTRGGEKVRILTRLGVRLRHGDVLRRATDDAPAVAINIRPCQLLFARPGSSRDLASLCYELGNLHVPLQIDNSRVMTISDGPVEAVLVKLGIPYETGVARFEPTLTAPTFSLSPGLGVE